MILYHVGFETIKKPDIHYGRKNADFGQGFYLTDDKEFSYRWAKERRDADTIINVYELDLDDLNVHYFERDEKWFNYVYANRNHVKDLMNADVIIGPIANDIIYDILGITTSGLLPKEDSMNILMIGPKYKQIVIKSSRALAQLEWIKSEMLTTEFLKPYHEQMKLEEEEFQTMVAKTLEDNI